MKYGQFIVKHVHTFENLFLNYKQCFDIILLFCAFYLQAHTLCLIISMYFNYYFFFILSERACQKDKKQKKEK